eukprot:3773249-Lingulodinium_polyedra.AAC.1
MPRGVQFGVVFGSQGRRPMISRFFMALSRLFGRQRGRPARSGPSRLPGRPRGQPASSGRALVL